MKNVPKNGEISSYKNLMRFSNKKTKFKNVVFVSFSIFDQGRLQLGACEMYSIEDFLPRNVGPSVIEVF